MTQQPSELIARLRLLRTDERRLRGTLVEDLRPFQKTDDLSFFTLPDSNRQGVSVATTCTALMALIDSDKLLTVFRQADGEEVGVTKQRIQKLFGSVVKSTWRSSGLRDLNAFTSCMVVRAAGFLVRAELFASTEVEQLTHESEEYTVEQSPGTKKPGAAETHLYKQGVKQPTLRQIIKAVAETAPDSFSIPNYPPKTTMAYWFVDGITQARIEIDKSDWERVASWAALQFNRELSYVVSANDARMDPASLAMAACLVSRIRKICAENDALMEIAKTLPSTIELMHAILEVFKKQTDSGIWHRYFPLFHFPGSGAADYCFSFEFLEAILIEFSEIDIPQDPRIVEPIVKAVEWCKNNRLEFGSVNSRYRGWNAGGDVSILGAGMPEAWATAAVHMFLAKLDLAIAALLDRLVLIRFQLDRNLVNPSGDNWKKLIDVDMKFPDENPTTLKTVIEEELLKSVPAKADDRSLRRKPLTGPRSALLFGPPGTSKTSICKAISERLGWPLLVITPSVFLSNGLEQIYGRVHDTFEDLMDISAAVVLFDEMDALVQTRGEKENALDVTRQLLTTSMLPKLANLWDQGRIIFLMATNHKQQLDPAIARPGRFDFLLCVGPPSWARKLGGLGQVMKDLPTGDLASVERLLIALSSSSSTQEQLDLFTVGELRSFLDHLRRRTAVREPNLLSALEKIDKKTFEGVVAEWAKTTIYLSPGPRHGDYLKDVRGSRR